MTSAINLLTGTITATDGAITLPVKFLNASRVIFSVQGTHSDTLVLEVLLNGVWFGLAFYALIDPATIVASLSTTATGAWRAELPPCSAVRVRSSTHTSGTATIAIQTMPY